MTVMAALVTIDSPGALLPKRLNGGRSGQMSGRPRRTLKCLNIYIHTYITRDIYKLTTVLKICIHEFDNLHLAGVGMTVVGGNVEPGINTN